MPGGDQQAFELVDRCGPGLDGRASAKCGLVWLVMVE